MGSRLNGMECHIDPYFEVNNNDHCTNLACGLCYVVQQTDLTCKRKITTWLLQGTLALRQKKNAATLSFKGPHIYGYF